MIHISIARTLCRTLLAFTVALPALAADTCGPEIEIPQFVLGRQIVILGELHGTQEVPRLAGEVSCVLARGIAEVVLALEIPEQEQKRISVYLESQGLPSDSTTLLQGDFWIRPPIGQDGRSSTAMFQLIERVRQLRGAGRRISAVAIDGQRTGFTRDGAMAQIVRELTYAKPQARVIALVGNIHALKDRGASFDRDYESFAHLLSDLRPLTLNVRPKRGSAWVCVEECGPRALTQQVWLDAKEPGIYLGQSSEIPPNYHGTVVLERAEASLPARTP